MDNRKAAKLSCVIRLLSGAPVFKRDSDIVVGCSFVFKHQTKRISTAISLEVLELDLFFSLLILLVCGIFDDVNSCRGLDGRGFCLSSGLVYCFIHGLSLHFVDVSLS